MSAAMSVNGGKADDRCGAPPPGQSDHMIVLFTDFGLHGPYTGQMKAVLHQMAPGIPVVDLFADAPVGSPEASTYLLAAYAAWFPSGTVFLCVVDPGVGGTRPAIIVEAEARWYVGPGNGLFELVRRRGGQTRSWDIDWKPERLSASFHGRDLFAPVAATFHSFRQVYFRGFFASTWSFRRDIEEARLRTCRLTQRSHTR